MKFSVTVVNFLGTAGKPIYYDVLRQNKQLPKVDMAQRAITGEVAKEIELSGKLIYINLSHTIYINKNA